jgi:porin
MVLKLVLLAIIGFAPGFALADDINGSQNSGEQQSSLRPTGYKVGYSTQPAFGGPNSPEGQLEEADRIKEPAFHFPDVYNAFEPWRNWKKKLNDDHGIQFTGHYTTLYQGVSDSLTGEDKASSGVFRATGKWTPVGRSTKDTGSLVVMIDNRHAFRSVAPAGLGAEAGYLGVTGTLYSDVDWVVVNLNWQQGFNDGATGLLVGRYDPSDYMNVLGYTNPWTTFQNVSILLDSSAAYADSSWGIGGGTWIQDQWYVMGGVNDANGMLTDDLEFFDKGSEYYTWGTVGWSPSQEDRYLKTALLTLWHVDERVEAGIDAGKGAAFATNWTFNEEWMPFFRAGWSQGNTPLYNRSATVGVIKKFSFRSDLVGVGINWGEPSSDSLREQTTIEAFWRFQFAQDFAITPSLQYLVNPALNLAEDAIWLAGLRMRLTF